MKREFIYAPAKDPNIVVIYEDDAFLVLDKPSGLLSVPGRLPEHADCLETRAQTEYPEARTVHRLDMATSGVWVMARKRDMMRHLGLQFERRHTSKTYIARVWGEIEKDEGFIDEPIIVDWPNRPKQKICYETGKSAQTSWRVLERTKGTTRVELTPITGRTHQLRIHMQHIGHPILADRIYAHEEAFVLADRLQLHAASITLRHPIGGEPITFKSPTPF